MKFNNTKCNYLGEIIIFKYYNVNIYKILKQLFKISGQIMIKTNN